MRKIFILSAICVLSLIVSHHDIVGQSSSVLISGGTNGDVLPAVSKIQNTKSKAQNSANYSDGVIDTLTWRNEGASRVLNYGFHNPFDSLLVWFNPAASCSLLSIRFRPMNWEGHILFNIWDASNYEPLIYSTDSTDENGWWGKYNIPENPSTWIPGDIVGHTPLGWNEDDPSHHYWGPYPITVAQEHADSWIEIPADSGSLGKVDLGNDPFYIGAAFFVTSGYGFYAQEPYPGSIPYSFFKYYYCSQWGYTCGWFLRSYFPWFEAIVKYYENTPPAYHDLKEQSYTYFSGPYPISVNIEDYDAEDANLAGVASVELVFRINGFEGRISMVGSSQGEFFAGEIPHIDIGDVVTYWVEATDLHGLSSQSHKHSFQRIEPRHPDADILLIRDNWREESQDSSFSVLFAVLDTHYELEYWDLTERNGIDASVINWGWRTIYISGQESRKTVPGRNGGNNLFVEWLESGTNDDPHNLIYIDQDYFCAHREYGCDWESQVGPGDFLFNYCGVASAVSDHHGSTSTGYDTAAVGMGDYAGTEAVFKGGGSRPDWIVEITDDAEQIFSYKDHPEYGAGVRLDRGHYKTCYLPWVDVLAFKTSNNGDMVPKNGLVRTIETTLDWFGTETTRDDRCKGLVGDPTGDGLINVLDVLSTVNLITGTYTIDGDVWCRADCNGDAYIDVLDVVGIVRVVLGMGECQP